ncbi:MAG: hypothetical protein ACI9FD_001376 [Gammaproteobacteria bacterium]|jgi:hypothetical protein
MQVHDSVTIYHVLMSRPGYEDSRNSITTSGTDANASNLLTPDGTLIPNQVNCVTTSLGPEPDAEIYGQLEAFGGQVIDAETGELLAGVEVWTSPASETQFTNERGEYIIAHGLTASYDEIAIYFSKPGYRDDTTTIIPSPGQFRRVDEDLYPEESFIQGAARSSEYDTPQEENSRAEGGSTLHDNLPDESAEGGSGSDIDPGDQPGEDSAEGGSSWVEESDSPSDVSGDEQQGAALVQVEEATQPDDGGSPDNQEEDVIVSDGVDGGSANGGGTSGNDE